MHPLKNFKGEPTPLGIGSGFSVPAINLKVLPTGLVTDGIWMGRQNPALTHTPRAPSVRDLGRRGSRDSFRTLSLSTHFCANLNTNTTPRTSISTKPTNIGRTNLRRVRTKGSRYRRWERTPSSR